MRLWPRRRVYVDDLPPTHDLRFAALFVLGFLLLLASLYGVGYVVAGDRLPNGTSVAGVDVGGMKRGEAATVLQEQLAPRLEHHITITVRNKTYSVDPQRSGMTFDIDATIDSGLGGGSWDPRHMLHVMSGGDTLQPVIDVDRQGLNAALRRISSGVERRAIDASVSFDSGRPVVAYAQEGITLDLVRSRRLLQTALLSGDDTITLPLKNVDPDVSSAAAAHFAGGVAKSAVSTPLSVRVVRSTIRLRPRAYVPALRTDKRGRELTLAIDADRLYARTSDRLDALPYHRVDARVVFRDGRPRVVPGQNGVTVSPSDWATAVLQAAGSSGSARQAVATVQPESPDFTTSDARMLRLVEPVSSAQVEPGVGVDAAAVTAVARQLDGTLLAPGDTLSFLAVVSTGTDAGAASTVASAAYRAALFGGMSEIQRTPDPVYSPAFADGMDARVEPPSVDLQWRNGTPYGVYVRSWVEQGAGTATVVHVQLWSKAYGHVVLHRSARYNVLPPRVQKPATPGCVPRTGVVGFDVDVTRTLVQPDQPRQVETIHTTYAPVDTIVCR